MGGKTIPKRKPSKAQESPKRQEEKSTRQKRNKITANFWSQNEPFVANLKFPSSQTVLKLVFVSIASLFQSQIDFPSSSPEKPRDTETQRATDIGVFRRKGGIIGKRFEILCIGYECGYNLGMLLQSSTLSSVEVGNEDLCISILHSYGLQSVPLPKSCCGQVLGNDTHGGSIQSCKLCGHSENILNMLLCDRCEEAFHVSCCNPRVLLPIDEWFCQSCSKVICKRPQNNSFPSLAEVWKRDLCISKLESYGPQSAPLTKSCGQVLGIGNCGGSIQSCELCGHSDNILNMVLCDHCEVAFHVSCCNPRVVLPIDEWFCHSCSKIIRKKSQNNSLLKSGTISPGIGIGPFKFELGPIAVMLKYPKPYMSKARIGKAFQAEVPDWNDQISVAPLAEVHTDDGDSSSALLLGPINSHFADPQLGSPVASRKRKQEFSS